jgi:hypothetical protein
MENRNGLNKFLVIAGVILVWLPILAPVFFSLVSLIAFGQFRFDYLMPAELFLFALAGSALLIWASLRVQSHTKLIVWALGGAVVMLVGAQTLAVVSGLANGDIEPVGLWWVLVLTLLVLSYLAFLTAAIGGILLLRRVFNLPKQRE